MELPLISSSAQGSEVGGTCSVWEEYSGQLRAELGRFLRPASHLAEGSVLLDSGRQHYGRNANL